MSAVNESLVIPIVLKEGSKYYYLMTAKDKDGAVVDISGGSFKANLLDKEGGTILDTMTLALVTDGTDGKYTELFSIADYDTLVAAGTLPTFWEVFFSADGTDANYIEWYRGPVTNQGAGS